MTEQKAQRHEKKTMTSHPQPGRELDYKVAEKLGLKIIPGSGAYPDVIVLEVAEDIRFNPVPYYSTDIAAAWQLVEHIHSKGHQVGVAWVSLIPKRWVWVCDILSLDKLPTKKWSGEGDTAPHAICLAFLALSESEVTE